MSTTAFHICVDFDPARRETPLWVKTFCEVIKWFGLVSLAGYYLLFPVFGLMGLGPWLGGYHTFNILLEFLPLASVIAVLYGFLQSGNSGYRRVTFEALKHFGLFAIGFGVLVYGGPFFWRGNACQVYFWRLLRLNSLYDVANVANLAESFGFVLLIIAGCYAIATHPLRTTTSCKDLAKTGSHWLGFSLICPIFGVGFVLLGLIDPEQGFAASSVFTAFAFLALGVTSLCLGARSYKHRKDLIAVSALFNIPFFIYLLSILPHYVGRMSGRIQY